MCVLRSWAATGLFLVLPILGTVTMPSGSLYGQEPGLGTDRWNRAALEWVALLKAGAFDEAGKRVAPEVPAGAMGAEQLRTIWGQLSAQLGALQSLDPGVVLEQGGYHIVDLPAAFEKQEVVVRVVLSEALMVSGFFIRPSEPPPYQVPPYVDEASFTESELTVGAEPWALPGVLTLPKGDGPFPAVVLVHGSGPNDRDETVGPNRPFRDLAWGLATLGVAVIRYDKRTKVHGPKLLQDIGLDEEVVDDAVDALELARSTLGIDPDRVFLLGHSLGGMLAPEVARRGGRVAGVAILAAPARPLLAVLKSQMQYQASLEPDTGSPAGRQLDSLVSVIVEIESGGWVPEQTLLGAPAGYWEEVGKVDPVSTAAELSMPLFVLQGGRDYQSTPEDLDIWMEALAGKAGFTAKLYPALNHLFAPGTGTATPVEYVSEVKPVDAEVIQDLAKWIQGTGVQRP